MFCLGAMRLHEGRPFLFKDTSTLDRKEIFFCGLKNISVNMTTDQKISHLHENATHSGLFIKQINLSCDGDMTSLFSRNAAGRLHGNVTTPLAEPE